MKKYKIVFKLPTCSVFYFGDFPSSDAVMRYVTRRIACDFPSADVIVQCLDDAE